MKLTPVVIAALAAGILAGCGAPDGKTMAGSGVSAAEGSGLNPIENYKQAKLKDALKGLTYDGAVRVDQTVASTIIDGPSSEGSMRAVKEAQRFFEGNDYVAAIKGFTKAVLLDVNNVKAYEGLAKSLITKGETAKAELAFKRAVELDPKDANLHHELALIAFGRNDLNTAADLWRKALEIDGSMTVAHERLAVLEFYRDNFEKSWQHVKRCEALGGEVPAQLKSMLAEKMAEPGNPPQN
ncbi:MAG: hypothetical protein HONBIEJF_02284 [Fimbriimonadaceae bacterium]|nr:hypothetical protein [Fimbriimonadaceae bacterium]